MNETFLKACRGEPVSYTPVWLMRQAGRFLPGYRALQGKYGFLVLCRTPELAAQATIQPVDVLGVDAAIFFSDILTTVAPMGLDLVYDERKGPSFDNPVRTLADIQRLAVTDPEESLPFVATAIRMVARELENKVPLIGFAGAPYTVAAYMVEGGTSNRYTCTKKLMYEEPRAFADLLDKVTRVTEAYLRMQIRAGAPCVMLFDSCAVTLGPRDYAVFELPCVKRIVAALRQEEVPVIYYVNGCAGLAETVRDSGADVIGVDWRLDLDVATRRLGQAVSVQGNLEPFALYLSGVRLEERVREVLDKGAKARGHIFNVGDGVLPDTPVDNVIEMVEIVHRVSLRKA